MSHDAEQLWNAWVNQTKKLLCAQHIDRACSHCHACIYQYSCTCMDSLTHVCTEAHPPGTMGASALPIVLTKKTSSEDIQWLACFKCGMWIHALYYEKMPMSKEDDYDLQILSTN